MWVIDSHTGGQPTRVVVEGGPDLGCGPLSDRRQIFAQKFDHYRRQCVLEPKCADSMVGALLCEPHDTRCTAGVIFFNTAGYLGMCGHGLIGLMVTLLHLGRITPGDHLIETPVGCVRAELLSETQVRVQNVESYRWRQNVTVRTEDYGELVGDIAWGGNWFFLARQTPVPVHTDNLEALTRAAFQVRRTLRDNDITGRDGAEIDHIEFFQPPANSTAHSKNFVLCPGGAYDRSPCGTGTSAKLACLAADQLLAPGEVWVQEGIVGSCFKGSYEPAVTPGRIVPYIAGDAYVFAETKLILNEADPFYRGIS